ncbi:MAG: hypothetical protein GY898_01430 [Proteobacteria bacterium]|nr:hypothetical protein [Pseudomonadota bacterium]
MLTGLRFALLLLVLPAPALAGTGGPDGFGYTWADSDEPGGPSYDSAAQPPWSLGGLCEDEWYTVALGFDFDFYGVTYD